VVVFFTSSGNASNVGIAMMSTFQIFWLVASTLLTTVLAVSRLMGVKSVTFPRDANREMLLPTFGFQGLK
jgi:hypothetical protein